MKGWFIICCCAALMAFTHSPKVDDRKAALQFIESKNYSYSIGKSAIPDAVIKGISEFRNSSFQLSDTGDATDRDEGGTCLHFVLLNEADSNCLFCYSSYGYLVYSDVYFVHYGKPFKLIEYNHMIPRALRDTASLISFLRNNPKPNAVWTKPDQKEK